MAFKNLLPPNVALGCNFVGTSLGFAPYRGTETVLASTEMTYKRKYSLKCITPGTTSPEGVKTSSYFPVSPSLSYTFSGWIYGLSGIINFSIFERSATGTYISQTNSSNIPLDGTWKYVSVSRMFGSTGLNVQIYISTSSTQAIPFYSSYLQLEQNDHATAWEFPGVDLTGNSITSNEAVQNLKLNQQLKLFSIASGEQVRNITVENILQLLQVPSSEYVNNLEICNSIFLEAIESTETVNELIVWIACEFMKCNITMKTPKAILKMKYPR